MRYELSDHEWAVIKPILPKKPVLYLPDTKYPVPSADDKRPTLAVSAWVQYVLDNYATTAEAVEALRREEFRRPDRDPHRRAWNCTLFHLGRLR